MLAGGSSIMLGVFEELGIDYVDSDRRRAAPRRALRPARARRSISDMRDGDGGAASCAATHVDAAQADRIAELALNFYERSTNPTRSAARRTACSSHGRRACTRSAVDRAQRVSQAFGVHR